MMKSLVLCIYELILVNLFGLFKKNLTFHHTTKIKVRICFNLRTIEVSGLSSTKYCSKVFIIRPGCSRLPEFEKKIVLVV